MSLFYKVINHPISKEVGEMMSSTIEGKVSRVSVGMGGGWAYSLYQRDEIKDASKNVLSGMIIGLALPHLIVGGLLVSPHLILYSVFTLIKTQSSVNTHNGNAGKFDVK